MANLLIERGGRAVGPFTQDEVRRYLAKGHLRVALTVRPAATGSTAGAKP